MPRHRTIAATLLAAAALAAALVASDEPKTAPAQDITPAPKREFNLAERRAHWCFQPVRVTPPPIVKKHDWPSSPIDNFILAKLEAAGIDPAPASEKRTLIRRVTFDITGLPPSPAEVRAFLDDDAPNALEKVVDRLLDLPHFGERWARHWLDLVRFAETRGHEFDPIIPNAFQYRDYVIRALNADVPYDQFVTEHVAGDLVTPPRLHSADGYNESVLGTGFWFLGEEVHSPVDIRGDETNRIDNQIEVFGKTFLGLTVSCARCHDHKFDPISAKDYYSLAGFLLSSSYRQVPFESMEQNSRVAHELDALRDRHRGELLRSIAAASRPTFDRLTDFLLATRDVSELVAAQPSTAVANVIQAVATKRQLDALRLQKWCEHVETAQQDRNAPLHAWALVARDEHAGKPERIRELLKSYIAEQAARAGRAAESLKDAAVIVDYARPGDEDWLPDGAAFGLRPTRPGDVEFSRDPARPINRILQFAAARTDPAWDALELAPGTERETGKAAVVQEGRMLRTPKFTLGAGRLYYLVEGAGAAYAAVDSHHMIAGPLHGSLVTNWSAAEDGRPRWVEHNLADYAGHRVHIEFSPVRPPAKASQGDDRAASTRPAAELAILTVVEAERPPANPADDTSRLLDMLQSDDGNSTESLARAVAKLFSEIGTRIAANEIANTPDASSAAWLANWIVQHPELFVAPSEESCRAIADVARPFFDEQSVILAKMRRVSRAAPALLDGNGVDEFLLTRGNHRTPAEPAARRLLEVLADPNSFQAGAGSGRLQLARQLTNPTNPLVARVMVNRIWHHLLGRGIVASVDNFGVLGERPTHPELLDLLADRFVRDGWSIKRMVRQIVLSNAYRMSSDAHAGDAADPQNLLLHRANVRRLDGEAIRDAILAISGRLDRRVGGPSVEVHLTPFMDGRGRPGTSGPLDGDGRRSIYIRVRRNFLTPMFTAFDFPTPFTTIGRRTVSNVPAQALAMMNSPFVAAEARRWAERVVAEPSRSDADRLADVYEAAFSRPPSPEELDDAVAFLQAQCEQYRAAPNDPRAWADLCHVLLNVKEFLFVR